MGIGHNAPIRTVNFEQKNAVNRAKNKTNETSLPHLLPFHPETLAGRAAWRTLAGLAAGIASGPGSCNPLPIAKRQKLRLCVAKPGESQH